MGLRVLGGFGGFGGLVCGIQPTDPRNPGVHIRQAALDASWSALRFRPLKPGEAPFTGGA
jgi:hypothetical protein